MADKKVFLIDRLLGENWFDDEKEAFPWAASGKILIGTKRVLSLKEKVPANADIRIKEYYKKMYAGKGGLKLQGALDDFNLDVSGMAVLDCGAAAGGFTDCLISRGARLVYAVDAGHGELAGKLRANKNVVNMERTNISDEKLKHLDPVPELITFDLSYLSLKKGIIIGRDIMRGRGDIISLIKPIVEVGSSEIKRSGEINDRGILAEILTDLCKFFTANGFDILGLTNSPVRGANGALEYFAHLRTGGSLHKNINYQDIIGEIIEKSFALKKFDKNNVML